VSATKLMVTALSPSKSAHPFDWKTPVKVPEAVTCLAVMETA
jgi:hypothetical protein